MDKEAAIKRLLLISIPIRFSKTTLAKVVSVDLDLDKVKSMSISKSENSMKPHQKSLTTERQIWLLFIVMVIIGYILTFVMRPSWELPPLRSWELALGIVFGLIYILIGLYERVFYERLPSGWAEVTFFSVECALIFGIGIVLGVGGSWLIAIPLVGFAVERLTPLKRLGVYVAIVVCSISPIGLLLGNWIGAGVNSITVGTAVVFVAVFAQMRLNEQQAREKAEQLMVELEKVNVQLATYATQSEELAMTQERNRLAREIHDNLGHTLTTVNVQIEAAKVIMDSEPDRALDAMNKAQELTQKGLNRVRESVAALRESPVSNRSLNEAIASLVEEAQSSGIVTEFKMIGEPQTLEHKVALALYRAAQEGLTNVHRHARASRVDVLLEFQPSEVRLEVKDNGVGAVETTGGFGLLGIRERMQLLGGRLETSSGIGKGFCLTASVLLSDADEPLQPEE
jgi:signal transduction histidine kinase